MGFHYNWDADDCSVEITSINWFPDLKGRVEVGALMRRIKELEDKFDKDELSEEEETELDTLREYCELED